MKRDRKKKVNIWLIVIGILFLLYAVLGNYVALPGYIRFLERGGTSVSGKSFDLSVLIGATKTILWMYSFQLGVLLISIAYSIRERLYTKSLIAFGFLWLILWSWPKIPAPGSWFYILFGSLIIAIITLILLHPKQELSCKLGKSLFLGAIVFFSFATWEVCGLGSTGRMLHPEQSSTPLAHKILVTQSTKLMFEFVLAWGLLLTSQLINRRSIEDCKGVKSTLDSC